MSNIENIPRSVTQDVRIPLHQSTDAANAFDGRVRRAVAIFQCHPTLLEGRIGAYDDAACRVVHNATLAIWVAPNVALSARFTRALTASVRSHALLRQRLIPNHAYRIPVHTADGRGSIFFTQSYPKLSYKDHTQSTHYIHLRK